MSLLICLSIFITSFSQEKKIKLLSTQNSADLNQFWTEFKTAIDNCDSSEIRGISLPRVDCIICDSKPEETPSLNYSISIDYFIHNNIPLILISPMWMALEKRGYRISARQINNFNSTKDFPENFLIYEIWIHTYLPDEWMDGHEGQSHAFQFVKNKNKFLFFGMTSVP